MADQPNAADQPNNLNHWLRAVRPDTPADHDWTDSAEADQVLAGVHRELAATGKPTGRRRPRRAVGRYWQPLVGGAVAAAAVVAALALPGNSDPNGTGFANNNATGNGSGQLAQPGIRPAAMLLSSTNSCGQLLTDLRSHTAAGATAYGLPGLPGLFYGSRALASSQALTDTRNAAGGSDPSATSTTNVQEAGVDEPDIVKTEPGRLISLVDGHLRIIDASSRKVTGSLDLTRFVGQLSAQLLVDGDHALVIAGNGNGNGYGGGASNGLISPYQPSSVRSTYLFIDLSGQPKITGSMRADGSYLDARQVGSTVRLVVRSAPAVVFPNNSTVAANQRLIRALPLSSWLPKYSISMGAASTAGTEHTVPCGQVSHPAAYTGTSLLTVYTLDLNHLAADAQPITVAADGDTVYANGDSLYLASNPDWFCCMPVAAAIPTAQRTQLHRFDISGSSRPSYLGSTSIPGRLLSQYSLSEYAGSLRVATTRSTLPGPGIASRAGQSSSVFVLDAASLKVTGQLDGLGQNEQIYAVRFEGPMAYLVTFRQTDPLFLIDLHDPAAPKVVGSLHLTGYSDYLHDLGQGRLLGVGQEASAAGKVAGLQVSLFDISTPANPTRTGHVVRPDGVGETTLDPHAFLFWQPTGLVVVPMQSWTAQNGQVLVLQVSGTSLRAVGLLANPRPAGRLDYGLGIQRSLIVDGNLWTVSQAGVQVSDPANLTRLAWISFG